MARPRIYNCETKSIHLMMPVSLHEDLMRFSDASGMPATRFIIALLMENRDVLRVLADIAQSGSVQALEQFKVLAAEKIAAASLDLTEFTQ